MPRSNERDLTVLIATRVTSPSQDESGGWARYTLDGRNESQTCCNSSSKNPAARAAAFSAPADAPHITRGEKPLSCRRRARRQPTSHAPSAPPPESTTPYAPTIAAV